MVTLERMTASSPTMLKSINPSTLAVLQELNVSTPAAIAEAASLSKQALSTWRTKSIKERLKKIEAFYDLLVQRKDEIARLITLEVGKPLIESYTEISGPLDTCLWLKKHAGKILSEQSVPISNPLFFGKAHYLKFEPAGVVGIVSPWNYPFSIPVMTILMALTAGNTIILKPSEKSSLVGLKIGELFREAGFPANTVTIITGGDSEGRAVVELGLDRLFFTGSVASGIKVMTSAAPTVTPCNLELGGKDAAIVLSDAPIERTAQALVWGAFTNAGQACASIERAYLVAGDKTSTLLKRVVELTKSLKVGDPLLDTTEVGPLIDVQQYDHVVNQVEQAIADGAKILCGAGKLTSLSLNNNDSDGKKLAGYFYEPTIISDINENMKIMQEETFGPILPVMIVDSVEEAIKQANNSMFGLTASIWSADIVKAQTIANQLQVGSVFINDCLYTHARPELPWGGLKKSGFGRSHSQFGLLDLVNIKQIAIDAAPWNRLWWYPYGEKKLKALQCGIEALHSRGLNKLSKSFEFLGKLFSLNK